MIQKVSISVPIDLIEEIRLYSKEHDIKISQIFRKGAKLFLEEEGD